MQTNSRTYFLLSLWVSNFKKKSVKKGNQTFRITLSDQNGLKATQAEVYIPITGIVMSCWENCASLVICLLRLLVCMFTFICELRLIIIYYLNVEHLKQDFYTVKNTFE